MDIQFYLAKTPEPESEPELISYKIKEETPMKIEYWVIKAPWPIEHYAIAVTRVDLPINQDYLAKQIRFKTEAEAIKERDRLNSLIK